MMWKWARGWRNKNTLKDEVGSTGSGDARCEAAARLLTELFDGEADAESAQRARAHLLSCASCARTWLEWNQTRIALRNDSVPAPPPTLLWRILLACRLAQKSASNAAPARPVSRVRRVLGNRIRGNRQSVPASLASSVPLAHDLEAPPPSTLVPQILALTTRNESLSESRPALSARSAHGVTALHPPVTATRRGATWSTWLWRSSLAAPALALWLVALQRDTLLVAVPEFEAPRAEVEASSVEAPSGEQNTPETVSPPPRLTTVSRRSDVENEKESARTAELAPANEHRDLIFESGASKAELDAAPDALFQQENGPVSRPQAIAVSVASPGRSVVEGRTRRATNSVLPAVERRPARASSDVHTRRSRRGEVSEATPLAVAPLLRAVFSNANTGTSQNQAQSSLQEQTASVRVPRLPRNVASSRGVTPRNNISRALSRDSAALSTTPSNRSFVRVAAPALATDSSAVPTKGRGSVRTLGARVGRARIEGGRAESLRLAALSSAATEPLRATRLTPVAVGGATGGAVSSTTRSLVRVAEENAAASAPLRPARPLVAPRSVAIEMVSADQTLDEMRDAVSSLRAAFAEEDWE